MSPSCLPSLGSPRLAFEVGEQESYMAEIYGLIWVNNKVNNRVYKGKSQSKMDDWDPLGLGLMSQLLGIFGDYNIL